MDVFMQNQKIAYTLYRVSSSKQLEKDKDKDDIPMQRQACREFAMVQGWQIGREFEEKGISGYKVSAENRDAIQDLKDAALKGQFEVLLVFMFDRIGRIDDETPFVVEWFVKHGIAVWSVKEGEQRFEHHVDKLTNYIRFWQAAGESEKTSMRTKTRLSQIVQEGRFRGGMAPFGYRLEKQGRFNKRNHELNEILIDEQESAVVRQIFDLYINQGFGSHRIAGALTERGVRTRSGSNFTNVTINHMLKNVAYIGVLRSGDTYSEPFPDLQIIDPHTFELAQNLALQRSAAYQELCVPLNTRGNSLLSGNVFCGHCGARLTVTTNGKKYHRQDGGVTVTPRTRYVCYNKTRHAQLCDGQTGYTVHKLDAIIDGVVHELFASLNDIPKEAVIAARCAEQIADTQRNLIHAREALQIDTAEVLEYEAEVLKVIRGESRFSSDLLNKLYEDAKARAAATSLTVRQLEEQLQNSEERKSALAQQFDDMQTWAELYGQCDMATKKMIIARLMRSVRVRRDYQVEIELTIGCAQLGLSLDAPTLAVA
jgi:DNA invertase Pin-like site-specific DNA recombinase